MKPPDSMRALYLQAPRTLRVTETPLPQLEAGDLLIKVEAATTCGTDLKAFRRGHPQIPMPGPFGHEYSGTVVATGAEEKFSVGSAIMGVHSAPCQTCYWCKKNQENLCESIMLTKVLGSYAEYLRIPARIANLNVYSKPDGLPFEQAALLEPLACVAQGLLELSASAGDRVLVIGPGAIGLMFAASLLASGVEDVTVAGRNPERLDVAASFGATSVGMDRVSGGTIGYDAVIECTGVASIWEQSVDLVRRGGKVMLFGGLPSGTRVSWDAGRLHYDQITLLSPFHFGTQAVRQAHQWLIGGRMNLERLISGRRRLDEAESAFADLEAGRGIKYVVTP